MAKYKEYFSDLEDAIKYRHSFYWDKPSMTEGRSGGHRCPKCKKWTQIPRKNKYEKPVFLSECEECQIYDPFHRMFHRFNKICLDEERDLYNNWLHKVKHYLSKLDYESISSEKIKLKECIDKLPFFEG